MTDREIVHFVAVGLGFAASGVLLFAAGRILRGGEPKVGVVGRYRVGWGDA